MTGTVLARVVPEQHSIVASPAPLSFTEEQSQMIRDSFANGASEHEFAILMEVAKARNLNPLLKQIHFVSRWDGKKNRFVWSTQISIDGLRTVAARTGHYDGQDEPENEYADGGGLVLTKVKVYRKGVSRPFVGIARWDEYVQTTKDGQPTKFWKDMPHTMLAKCAEALAIRKAFPEDASGLYVAEEMQQADNPISTQPLAPQLPRVNPHDDGGDYSDVDEEAFLKLQDAMDRAEDMLKYCDSHQKMLELAEYIGGKAKQSELTKAIQAAKEARLITPEHHKSLSKTWAHIYRELEKEKPPGLRLRFPAPSAVELMTDEPQADPAEDFDR